MAVGIAMLTTAEREGDSSVQRLLSTRAPDGPEGTVGPEGSGADGTGADAAGADALLVADAATDPWNPNAIRASTGAVFTLPVVEATLDDVLALPLQKVAAVVGAPTHHTDADLRPPTALLVGAEDAGLDERWRGVADLEVSIPMHPRSVDSLSSMA